jgi:hypothetical protein
MNPNPPRITTPRTGLARIAQVALTARAVVTVEAPTKLAHAAEVGVSVSISEPGFYGRVDIGNTQPVLVYPQPVVITPGPYAVHQRPIYMRVPPGHAKDWGRYCGRYQACGQPVYFIKDGGPAPRTVVRERERHHEHEHDRDRKAYKGNNGNGKGNGKDKGHR